MEKAFAKQRQALEQKVDQGATGVRRSTPTLTERQRAVARTSSAITRNRQGRETRHTVAQKNLDKAQRNWRLLRPSRRSIVDMIMCTRWS